MRTTITLEPETAALIQKAMRERKLSFKQVVNEAIRAGLVQPERRKVQLPTHRLGVPRVNLDKALQLAGELEDAEIARKMSMGK